MNQQEMKNALHENVCTVTFTKVNGDERVMRCTLKTDLLPAQQDIEEAIEKKSKKPNPDVLAVYDLNAAGWRSFRWDKLKDFKVEQ
jgi:CMP-N-acetylneuraminic acid synthetase